MIHTYMGCGLKYCFGRGNLGWGSADVLLCFVFWGLPIIPIKPLHVYNWETREGREGGDWIIESRCDSVLIRWSFDLVLRVFLGHWIFLSCGVSFILFILGVYPGPNPIRWRLAMVALALCTGALSAFVVFAMHVSDRRNRHIRVVLGGLTVGNCDPAHMPRDLLRQLGDKPRRLYGTKTFAEAAELMFEQEYFAMAMYAARLCVARESASEGEWLTNVILADPRVLQRMEQVLDAPRRWQKLMNPNREQASPCPMRDQDWSESEEWARDRQPPCDQEPSPTHPRRRRERDED